MLKQLMIVAFGLLATSTVAAADGVLPLKWQEGKHYFLVEPPQPTASGKKVEVLEIFSYACVHCAHFQPTADRIKKQLPDYATFGYMPAIFSAQWEPFARAFYTAQSLGVLDKTHQQLFDALHTERRQLTSIDALAGFYAGYGVSTDKFLAASKSFEVESKIARSLSMVPKYGIDGTPSIIVNGKYRLSRGSAGSDEQVVELVEYLVEKARTESAAKK